MHSATRAAVWRRAGAHCEYCRLHQDDDPFAIFHVEHIIARQTAGSAGHRCTAAPSAR
jgi:hypothetical protein